jgi:prepilin-type N-terminal cleavage/methylation domain-containing protein
VAAPRLSPRRLRRACARQEGLTLIELLIVLVVLGTILGALTTVFANSTSGEADLNSRFQAQMQAQPALDKLRRDVRCASAVTPTGAASSVTLTLPSSCSTGSGQVSWCAVGSGTRYALYREAGATCDSSGSLVADYLVSSSVFTYTAPVSGTSLGKLQVDLQVNVTPGRSSTGYELTDTIAALNTGR